MSTKRNVSILIGIIGILILLLAGTIGYIIANEGNGAVNNSNNSAENAKVLKEIEALKQLYDTKIADKTNNYVSLQIQKDSIEALVRALEDSKSDADALIKYKTQYQNLESKMKILVDEIVVLKSKKSLAITKKGNKPNLENEPVFKKIVDVAPIKNEGVASKKENPISKNEDFVPKSDAVASKSSTSKEEATISKSETTPRRNNKNVKITLSDVAATAYNSKSATKKVPTDAASKTDFIKITFTIDGNSNFGEGEKTYYFQILNNKNNVMGKRITEYFDNEALTYSFSKSFNYDGQSVQVSQEFLNAKFEKGYYFVNIFDRDALVGKTSFQLK